MKKQPHQLASWQKLSQHKDGIQKTDLRKMFAEDPKRFESFTRTLDGILVDFSKNLITDETLKLFSALAAECGLSEAIGALQSRDHGGRRRCDAAGQRILEEGPSFLRSSSLG